MTASKVGTSYLKLTIPCMFLPSYFKNRTAPCVDRYEYGLFTAARTLVVRMCMQLIGKHILIQLISLSMVLKWELSTFHRILPIYLHQSQIYK